MILFPTIYKDLITSSQNGKKLLGVLIDPEKFKMNEATGFFNNLPKETSHVFVGGSTCGKDQTQNAVKVIKSMTSLPVILFPGSHNQITDEADAILFLSLISGRNPDYLIEQQVKSVSRLRECMLEIIPTGYILIDGGRECAVERVSQTSPMLQNDIENIINTALAGEFSGKKLIYLEAGSGAKNPVGEKVIFAVKQALSIPLIVGGGIRSRSQLLRAYEAGADLVVIGTAFEEGASL